MFVSAPDSVEPSGRRGRSGRFGRSGRCGQDVQGSVSQCPAL